VETVHICGGLIYDGDCGTAPKMDRHPLNKIAVRLGISIDTLKRRIRESGILPARPGRAVMLTEEEINAVMEASRYRCRLNSELDPENETGG